jgi:hypothetical protein
MLLILPPLAADSNLPEQESRPAIARGEFRAALLWWKIPAITDFRANALPVRLWRLAMKPVSGLPLLVGDRSNPDQIFKLEIEDAEWKTVQQALPVGCALVGRPPIRMLLDEIDDALYFCLEGKAKPCSS